MNMYNSENENFESSLQKQFEMQSCTLDESESKPNITLKKMGQELDKAETKCITLKSELNYMMGVCRKAQTEIKGSKGTSDISLESKMSSPRSTNLKSSIGFDRENETTIVNRNLNYNAFQKIHNIEPNAEENIDSFHLSPRSAQFSFKKSVDDIMEKSNLKEGKQRKLLNVAIKPKIQVDKKFPPEVTMMPIQHETVKANEEYENSPYCFPEYVHEHVQSMLSIKSSIEAELTSKADVDYFCAIPNSARGHIGGSELNLNSPADVVKVALAKRSKRGSRMERSESSICKTSDLTSKARRRKGKLRNSISKSTITTRDTNFFSRKDTKKRKHKSVTKQQSKVSNTSKYLKRSNDVVEIFHNTTLKSSNSGMFDKPSKFNRSANNVKRKRPDDVVNHKIQETSCFENVNPKNQSRNKESGQIHCPPILINHQNNSEAASENIRDQDKPEENSNNLDPSAQCKISQSEQTIARYEDPTFVPSYEMSTLSSRLKRSNRLYFSRFNFQNIPFVVGTSVTPSYNLGLNIQQMLSVMKTRQPMASNITPLLIHKVSRGMKPVSSLLEQIRNVHCEKSIFVANSRTTGMFNSGENTNVKQDKRSSIIDSRHLCKEQSDSCDRKIKSQSSSAAIKSNTIANTKNQQKISKDNIGDHKIRIPGSYNTKEIRNIMINLHDQFEEMNAKYEKLQSEAEKSNDKSLSKELSALEKELNVKEEEINAVVGLYKEVRTLKQQMKMLHEKNSLVCIATESIKDADRNPFLASIMSEKSNVINPTQIFGRRKNGNATREPPASMQLAALLRQIQTFHKQLQLVS